jgi:hypothetical protein
MLLRGKITRAKTIETDQDGTQKDDDDNERKKKKKRYCTKSEAVEESLKIDYFASVGELVEVVDGALGLPDKDIVGVLTEGFDGEDLARHLSLPLPVLLGHEGERGWRKRSKNVCRDRRHVFNASVAQQDTGNLKKRAQNNPYLSIRRKNAYFVKKG